jgi:hypothetical protein
MSANLVRVGGGLAAMLGGILGVIASLMALVFVLPRVLSQTPNGLASSSIITLTGVLLILAWVLVSVGLVGLYESQQEAVGVLGVVGFAIALVGSLLVVGVLCIQTFNIGVSGGLALLLAGIVVILSSVGWFLFALATYRASIYPRAAAILLMVGAAINLAIHLSGGEFIVMAAAIAWLGYFLFRGRASLGGEAGSRISPR